MPKENEKSSGPPTLHLKKSTCPPTKCTSPHSLVNIAPSLMYVYVVPSMIHGLEALNLAESEYQVMEAAYRKLLRQIQHHSFIKSY